MLWLIPHILTFGRLVLTGVFLAMLLCTDKVSQADLWWFLDIAFVVFVVAGLTDIVDGLAARRLNATSKLGRMMDPLVDKVLICGGFLCFAIIKEPVLFGLGQVAMSLIRWSVAGILIFREVYVTVLRHTAEAHGISFPATASGKIKMFLQSFAVGTVMIKAAHVHQAPWGDWFTTIVFAAMLIVTVISGIRATKRTAWQKAAR